MVDEKQKAGQEDIELRVGTEGVVGDRSGSQVRRSKQQSSPEPQDGGEVRDSRVNKKVNGSNPVLVILAVLCLVGLGLNWAVSNLAHRDAMLLGLVVFGYLAAIPVRLLVSLVEPVTESEKPAKKIVFVIGSFGLIVLGWLLARVLLPVPTTAVSILSVVLLFVFVRKWRRRK